MHHIHPVRGLVLAMAGKCRQSVAFDRQSDPFTIRLQLPGFGFRHGCGRAPAPRTGYQAGVVFGQLLARSEAGVTAKHFALFDPGRIHPFQIGLLSGAPVTSPGREFCDGQRGKAISVHPKCAHFTRKYRFSACDGFMIGPCNLPAI